MVERPIAEGRVGFTDLDDDEVSELRCAVDFAKRHGLEPHGKRIENARIGVSVVPASTRQTSLHSAVAALKEDDP
ncbi:hypothetical protein AB0N81_13025 [Streptomyces sp. NPDC093510]|uniref:hypothetical protein n=1 Tax=Streptomyces sp. NPDC093510 TaxID=3155199 RepID=UPI00343917C8